MFKWLRNWLSDSPPRDEEAQLAELVKAATQGARTPVGSLSGDTRNFTTDRELMRHFTGWTYAAINVIAKRIAGQPILVGRKPKLNPRKGQFAIDEDPSHPLAEAFEDPNELMVQATLLLHTVSAMELSGKAYWMLDQRPEKLDIWPIPPHWVRPLHEGGNFARYEIYPQGRSYSAEPLIVNGDEMIRFYYPNPADPLSSWSPLQAAAKAVLADEAIQETHWRAFKNGIFPGLAIKVGRLPNSGAGLSGMAAPNSGAPSVVLTKQQRQSIITAIKNAYSGAMKFDEPIIMDGLIEDIKRISNSQRELDFLNSGKVTKARIFQAFGVNPISAGEIENANRAQAAVADEQLVDGTINPKLMLLNQCMTSWFRYYYSDPDLVVGMRFVRPRDAESRRQELDVLAKFGSITINELRGELGLGSVEGGDVLIEPRPSRQRGGRSDERSAPFQDQGRRSGDVARRLAEEVGASRNGHHRGNGKPPRRDGGKRD